MTTSLRQRMIDDMRIRNLAPNTQRAYLERVAAFARHFGRSPSRLLPEDVRAFQIHIVETKRCAVSTLRVTVAALRFLYRVTLGVGWRLDTIPYPRKPRPLPVILSPGEVARFLAAVERPKYHALLSTIYATGLRLNEALALIPADVDKNRRVLRVLHGKGMKARYAPLPDSLLRLLRDYWRRERLSSAPSPWLFPQDIDPSRPACERVVRSVIKQAAAKASLKKNVTPHLLRHCAATHLLEAGTDLRTVQVLLGHKRLESTAFYTHVAANLLSSAPSLLDRLALLPKPKSS